MACPITPYDVLQVASALDGVIRVASEYAKVKQHDRYKDLSRLNALWQDYVDQVGVDFYQKPTLTIKVERAHIDQLQQVADGLNSLTVGLSAGPQRKIDEARSALEMVIDRARHRPESLTYIDALAQAISSAPMPSLRERKQEILVPLQEICTITRTRTSGLSRLQRRYDLSAKDKTTITRNIGEVKELLTSDYHSKTKAITKSASLADAMRRTLGYCDELQALVVTKGRSM